MDERSRDPRSQMDRRSQKPLPLDRIFLTGGMIRRSNCRFASLYGTARERDSNARSKILFLSPLAALCEHVSLLLSRFHAITKRIVERKSPDQKPTHDFPLESEFIGGSLDEKVLIARKRLEESSIYERVFWFVNPQVSC